MASRYWSLNAARLPASVAPSPSARLSEKSIVALAPLSRSLSYRSSISLDRWRAVWSPAFGIKLMTKLRWSDPPREFDPARVQRQPNGPFPTPASRPTGRGQPQRSVIAKAAVTPVNNVARLVARARRRRALIAKRIDLLEATVGDRLEKKAAEEKKLKSLRSLGSVLERKIKKLESGTWKSKRAKGGSGPKRTRVGLLNREVQIRKAG